MLCPFLLRHKFHCSIGHLQSSVLLGGSRSRGRFGLVNIKQRHIAIITTPFRGMSSKSNINVKLQEAIQHFEDCIRNRSEKETLGSSVNSHCPWSKKLVQEDSLSRYRNFPVGFCNTNCRDEYELALKHLQEHAGLLQVPSYDHNEYDQFVLSNGILVTVISDSSLQRSAAAMSVGVGASSDPLQYPGLAHFTEHMLFLGTEKYPSENHYKAFLNKHGGSSNASTSMESTTYKFDVNYLHFNEALDIFSQFFVRPLLSEESVDREINAVDAEDSKNRQLDSRRALQVVKSLMHCPITPNDALSSNVDENIQRARNYAKYSTGNAHTLRNYLTQEHEADATRDELASKHTAEAMKAFYSFYYMKAPMSLSLIGPQSIEELRALSKTHFEPVFRDPLLAHSYLKANHDLQAAKVHRLPLTNPFSDTGILVRLPPVKEMKELTMIWTVPPIRHIYRQNPCRLMSHLLGYEGEGSAYALLQAKGWITSLSAGTRASFDDSFSLFQVSLSLTPLGIVHYLDVMNVVYAHISALREISEDQMQEYWQELGVCDWLDFHYNEKGLTAREQAAEISARGLITANPHHVLSRGFLYDDELSFELLQQFVGCLNPSLAVCLFRHKGLADWISTEDKTKECEKKCNLNAKPGEEANRIEKWYGIHFHVEKLDNTTLEQLQSLDSHVKNSIYLPRPNKYIPHSLKEESIRDSDWNGISGSRNNCAVLNIPDIVHSDNSRKLLCTSDKLFGHPRTALFLLASYHNASFDADGRTVLLPYEVKQRQLNRLTSKFYEQMFASLRYPAEIAGLFHSVNWLKRGVEMSCFGFTPHLGELFKEILQQRLKVPDSSHTTLFDNVKEKHIRALQSWYKFRPDSQCSDLVSFLLEEDSFLIDDEISAAKEVLFEDVISNMHRIPSFAQSEVDSDSTNSGKKVDSADEYIMYAHGNMPRGDVEGLYTSVNSANSLDATSSSRKGFFEPSRVYNLEVADSCILLRPFNTHDSNSALVSQFQAARACPVVDATLLLLQRYLHEPLFNSLRTTQQLGYIVSVSKQSSGQGKNRVGGLAVRILSKKYDPIHLKQKVDDFLEAFPNRYLESTIANENEFAERVKLLSAQLLEPPSSYRQEAASIWSKIRHDLPQDYLQQTVAAMGTLSLLSLQDAFDKWILNGNSRKRISLMLCANEHMDAAQDAIRSNGLSVDFIEHPFNTLRAMKSKFDILEQ